jgi:hypothetical protein
MSSPRTPHRENAMTKDGRWKVSFNLAAPFYRVRSGKPQRLRYTALNGTSSSAQSRQPPEPESSIRVPGRLPMTRMHRDSSRCLARALPVAPPVCDTTAAAAAAARMAPGAGRRSVSHGPPESPPGRVAPSRSESGSPPLAPSAASDSGCPVRLRVARPPGLGKLEPRRPP